MATTRPAPRPAVPRNRGMRSEFTFPAANVGGRCRSQPSLVRPLRGVAESCVLHAAFSPAAALLQPLVAGSPAAFFVLCNYGAKLLYQSPAPMLAAGACWCLRIVICSVAVLSAQPSSPIVPLFILRRSIVPCPHKLRRTCSAVAFASSVFGMSQLVLHEENGLLEIFLSMCESSAPASGCRDARRQQEQSTLLPLLCWPSGARDLLHHNHLVCTQTLT